MLAPIARKSVGIASLLLLLTSPLLPNRQGSGLRAAESLRLLPLVEADRLAPPVRDENRQKPAPVSPPPHNLGDKPGKPKQPHIAIIIDDMGYHPQLGPQLLQLDLNLTFSFLPEAPYTKQQAETAFQRGRNILVHLPMEPQDPTKDPGPEALTLRDTAAQLQEKVAGMVGAVPHARGANNHMGSRFTEEAGAMRVVLAALKSRSLFFIDSLTTPKSQGWNTAQELRVRTERRNLFLDNVQEPDTICRQIEHLTALARERGGAIGIGHPNQAMYTALVHCAGNRRGEVELIGVEQLVH